MQHITLNLLFVKNKNKCSVRSRTRAAVVRRKSATAEAAERQYRATAEVAQRRRRYAPAAAALGWAGRDAAAALKCTSRKNHAIPPFVGVNVADVSISIKGRNSLPMRTRQRGENPAFAGRAGRSQGEWRRA